jgi:hypothetical protein
MSEKRPIETTRLQSAFGLNDSQVQADRSIPSVKNGEGRPLFFVCPFGSLQRVDLLRRFFEVHFEMGGCGTFSSPPFSGRVRIHAAVFAGRALDHLAAPIALIYDDIAAPPVESAAFLRHEAAFDPVFNRLTDHLSLLFFPIEDGLSEV